MTRRIRFPSLLAGTALSLSLGCTSTPDAIPNGGADITLSALNDGADAGLSVAAAQVSFTGVTIVPCAADAAELSSGAFAADLRRDPAVEVAFESSVTDYCAVRIDFGAWPHQSQLPELEGLSTLVTGKRSADEAPIELRSSATPSFTFTSPSGPFDAQHLVVGIDLAAWFGGVGVGDIELDDDGVALIDADRAPEALAAFDAAVASAWSLYVDADRDGTLTGDELTPFASAELAAP